MNKRISLLLVLSLVLGMFAPMATYADKVIDTTEAAKVLEWLKGKKKVDIDEELAKSLKQEHINSVNSLIDEVYDALIDEVPKNSKAEEKLIKVYKIDNEMLGKLKEASTIEMDVKTAQRFVKELNTGDFSDDTLKLVQGVLNKQKDILNEAEGLEGKTWAQVVLKDKINKTKILDELFKEAQKRIKLEDVCNNGDIVIEATVTLSQQEAQEIYGKNHNEIFQKTPKFNKDRYNRVMNIVRKSENKFEEVVNKDLTLAKREALKSVFDVFEFTYDFKEDLKCPEEGGEGGGGTVMPPSTGVTPPSTTTEYREDKDAKEVFLDEKHLDIKKVGDKTTIKISDKHVSAAIAQLKKSLATEAKDMTLTVVVPEETGFNVDFELSGKAIKTLADNKVDFKVSSSKGSLVLPFDALDAKTLADNESIKLKLDKIDNKIVSEKVRDEDAVKKAVDIYIERTKDGKATRVDKVNKPLRAVLNVKGLGDKDLLALYNMNNDMDFVTGKIRNENMTFKIEELGKHVLVETHMGYNDTKTHWAKDEIKSMTAKNVVNGVGKNLFKPNANVTRAEFAKMIVASLEVELVEYDGTFKDVKKSDWFAEYVSTAHELGIVKGKSVDTFKPNESITREEMATMLSRLDETELTKEEVNNELKKYKDSNKVSEWAKPHVAKASKLGIMTGKKIGLDPKANATRAEAATTMFRIYNRY